MNLPNKLTMLRICMIPVFVVFAVINAQWAQYVALAIYIIAAKNNSPLILNKVCGETCIGFAIIDIGVVVAHYIALAVGPILKVVTGVGSCSDFYSLHIGD